MWMCTGAHSYIHAPVIILSKMLLKLYLCKIPLFVNKAVNLVFCSCCQKMIVLYKIIHC